MTVKISLAEPEWRTRLEKALVDSGSAMLTAPPSAAQQVREAIMEVQGLPIDAGFLMLHPRVIGVRRENAEVQVHLELREAFQ
jgi:hypothetical protein